jgi:uncharacterized protein (DUF1810 family)
MEDPYRLDRFIDAQNDSGEYQSVVSELQNGRKLGHWMWYIFPQVRGLGRSWTSQKYAITSLAEARAYLEHPQLGPRLLECARLLLRIEGKRASDIFGSLDAMKLRSCMTLFSRADPQQATFRQVLDKYFQGAEDQETIRLLGGDD